MVLPQGDEHVAYRQQKHSSRMIPTDVVTLGVLWQRLTGLMDEVAQAFVRTSFSAVVRENSSHRTTRASTDMPPPPYSTGTSHCQIPSSFARFSKCSW